MRIPRALMIAAVLGLALAGCAGPVEFSAAGDIHALMIAIRDDDQAAFDAHVDRPALKAQLAARLQLQAQRGIGVDPGVAALGMALARPLVDAAADQLVQPEVFRAVAEHYGYSAKTPIPGRFIIARALNPVDAATVCVTDGKANPCMLKFRNESGIWRLVGFEGDQALLKAVRAD